MAESVQIKFDYQERENVEAQVPGAQNLRASLSNETGEIVQSNSENASNNDENASSKGENSKETLENRELISSQGHSEEADGEVVTRHRHVFSGKRNGIHGEPVMLDKQINDKKSRTRIPVSRFRQAVENVKAERRDLKAKREQESHIPVRRSSIPKPMKDQKLPTTTVKKEITITKTEISNDSEPIVTKTVIRTELSEPTPTKIDIKDESVAPEDEFDKIYAEIVDSTPTEVILDDSLLNPKVEDPEKLESKFEEIIHDYDEHKVEPIDVEVVRRSKIPFLKRMSQQDVELNAQAERTSKIIAARDKLRLRNNPTKNEDFEDELDEELKNTQANPDADVADESTEKISPTTDTKTEIEHIVTATPNSTNEITRQTTKTVSTSSSKQNEDNESSSMVTTTTTVEEVTTSEINEKKENKQQNITEENIVKDSIKIGIPVFNSYVEEFSERNETAKMVEVKTALSYSSKIDDLTFNNNISKIEKEIVKNDEIVQNSLEDQSSINKDSHSENINNKSQNLIDEDKVKTKDTSVKLEEAITSNEVQLRGRIERITSKIDSKENIETEGNKRESINELTKKKSVLSKIAMFEKKEIDEPLPKKGVKKETKLPKLITKEWQKVEHVHMHTPLIVDEVFKPFQANLSLTSESNKKEKPMEDDVGLATLVKEERVTVHSSDSVHYAAENKVQIESKTVQNNIIEEVIPTHANIDPEYAVQKVETVTITDVPRKRSTITNDFSSKDLNSDDQDENLTKTGSATKLNMTKELLSPVVIPGFKPVSELLRSFESKKEANRSFPKRTISKIEYTSSFTEEPMKMSSKKSVASAIDISYSQSYNNESNDGFESVNDYKSLDDVFSQENDVNKLKRHEDEMRRAKSLAELDIGDAVKGKVNNIVLRMKSVDRIEVDRKEVIMKREMPRKRSVSEKIALFEGKLTPSRGEPSLPLRIFKYEKLTEAPRTGKKIENTQSRVEINKYNRLAIQREKIVAERTEKSVVENERSDKSDEELIKKKIEDLKNAKTKYGKVENMPGIELSNGVFMPALAIGTALLDPRLTYHIVTAAIDLGYRAIDTAFIYGNEKEVGEAIKAKINDRTVKREELFIISKLWSTYHRSDLVEGACRASLGAMGLDYFDLYLIHNPMSFKEGGAPIPKIATVIQFSEYDYLDAWYGMEPLVAKGLVRAIGVSNFNSVQLQRVLDKGKIKPVVNQVECHPYLSQQRLDLFCSDRNVTLSCFGVLGSKGTPLEMKSGQTAVIDDALVQVMASGLGVSPAQLLISYQLESGHGVVVKASSAAHLWDNLGALDVHLTMGQVDALHALNRNKRTFTFKGMGDTHRNYPFNIAF